MIKTLALQSSQPGCYLCAEEGGNDRVTARAPYPGPAAGPWETFAVELYPGNQIALRTANSRYLCAEEGGGGRLSADREAAGPWERWTIVGAFVHGGQIGLKSWNGHFLCAEDGGGGEVNVTRESQGAWETWTVRALEQTSDAPSVHPKGRSFWNADGTLHRGLGAGMFVLPMRHAAGEDIGPQRAWLKSHDLQWPWVFTMLDAAIRPWWHPGWPMVLTPVQLAAFLDEMTADGFGLDVSLLADCQRLNLDTAAQRRHVAAMTEVLAHYANVVVRLGNEHLVNGWRPDDFRDWHPPFPHSYGTSSVRTAPPVGGTHIDYEPGRTAEWMREAGKQGAEYSYLGAETAPPLNLACRDAETMGAAEFTSDKRSNDPAKFYDAFACSFLFLPWAVFHSEPGMQAAVPGPLTDACATAVQQAARDVPLNAHLGTYTAGHIAGCPMTWADGDALRLYGMVQGTKATMLSVSMVREPQPRDGWRVVERRGPRQQVFLLER